MSFPDLQVPPPILTRIPHILRVAKFKSPREDINQIEEPLMLCTSIHLSLEISKTHEATTIIAEAHFTGLITITYASLRTTLGRWNCK
jgi:hypothetical protein